MPSAFPADFDELTYPAADDPLNDPPHHTVHGELNDAIIAIEEKVGIDGSDDPASIEYRLTQIEDSGHVHVWNDTINGSINGSNAVFTLSFSPSPAASLMLFMNGLLLRADGNDFTLVGNQVTFTQAPPVGSTLLAHYVR